MTQAKTPKAPLLRLPVICSLSASLAAFALMTLLMVSGAAADHTATTYEPYRFPWYGTTHRQQCITQGWGGGRSHYFTNTNYALDVVRLDGDAGTCLEDPPIHWTIRSASSGYLDICHWDTRYPEGTANGFGYHVHIRHYGNHVLYAHKWDCSGVQVPQGGYIGQGRYELGTTGCSGECDGEHLHFDVWQGTSLSDSGRVSIQHSVSGESAATLSESYLAGASSRRWKASNNQAVAESDWPNQFWKILDGYLANGGWGNVGSPAAVGDWSPCHDTGGVNSSKVYNCSHAGNVQTFRGAGYASSAQHAIIQSPGASIGRMLYRGILGAYTTCYPQTSCQGGNQEWGTYLGHPLNDRYSQGSYYRQDFLNGHIRYYPSSCRVEVWFAGSLTATYTYCD